jgi:hypothetical protein
VPYLGRLQALAGAGQAAAGDVSRRAARRCVEAYQLPTLPATPDDDVEPACPYCDNTVDCPHLLLVVDTTFRSAEAGVLMEPFNSRWFALQQSNPDTDERELFDSLLDEVEALAGAIDQSTHDSVPGLSSAYRYYYVSSARKAKAAMRSFVQ